MIEEAKQLFQGIDEMANGTLFNNQKLLDGTFKKSVGTKEFVLQIDDLRSAGLGLDITTVDTDLGSAESATKYLETISQAITKVNKNRNNVEWLQTTLEILQEFYETENDIIDSATPNMDKAIAKAALIKIKNILVQINDVASRLLTETYDDNEKAIIKYEMDTYLIAIDHIANNADFNGQKLLDGTFENISKINTTTLGGGTKLPTDISTVAEAEATKAKYQKAIEMIEQEIAKLEV